MSTTRDLIRKRQSIRKYHSQPVPNKLILEAMEAANWAPSAHNAQPWRLILVSDIAVKQILAKAMADAWINDLSQKATIGDNHQRRVSFSIKRFSTAPIVIVACLSLENMKKHSDTPQWGIERDLAIQSLGAAVQNLLLSASGNNLGACWFSAPIFCKDTVRQVLAIPKTVEPQAIILMGYPDEKPDKKPRKSINEFCFQNRWDNPLNF